MMFLKSLLQAAAGLANVCLVASVTAYFIDATFFKFLGGIVHFWF
jgi:hypothetical protein